MDDYDAFLQQAKALVDEGRGKEVLVERASGPWPIVASAGTVLSLWGTPGRLEDTTLVKGLQFPLLITLDNQEALNGPTISNVEQIISAWEGPVTRVTVTGAGHLYLNNQKDLAAAVLPWLTNTVAPA